MKKLILAVLFIVIAVLLQLLLNGILTRTGSGEWIKVANIIWGLVFWLGLWRLSSGGYKDRRGAGRWIGLTGMTKAF